MKNKYQLLSDVSNYNMERFNPIYREEFKYISTENMLENKNGVIFNLSYPISGTVRNFMESDILISNIRPYFKKIWFADRVGGCSDDILVIRAKNIYPKFLYYVLCDSNFFNYSTVTAKGTKMPRGSKDAIMRYLVPDVPIHTQEKIADILSTYDDLIENNNRRIEILEQMAQEIYKEWFVRFRFPGHEKVKFVSSKLGKLPQTFNVVNAESLFEFYIGGGWGNENISENFPIEANVIRGTDIPNVRKYDISSCPMRYHKKSNYTSRQLVNGDIVMEISGGTADQPVGRCALITQELIDRFKNGNVICASFCKLIRLKKNIISPYFFYYWLQYLYDTRIIDRFQLQSTGIINFKFEAFLKKGLIMLPPMNIMLQFENYVKYIVQEINMLASQNQNLIKQRDLLLPRLMSGKLEV